MIKNTFTLSPKHTKIKPIKNTKPMLIPFLKNNILKRVGLLNRLFSELIDYHLLRQLHNDRSKTSHFSNISSPIPPEELNNFYFQPKLPKMQLANKMQQGSHFFGNYQFESEIKDNGKENAICRGDYFKSVKNDTSLNVILVHGWRMDSLDRMNDIFLNDFLELGYNVYYYTLPFHFDRTPQQSLYNGELMVSADIDRSLLSVKQAITDLRALVCWLKENSSGKVALIGISLGGFITNLACAIEEKIDMLISVMYANSISYSVWNTTAGKYIKKDFESNGFTFEQLKEYWAVTDPSLFKPKIPKENILLFSGLYDKFVVKEDTDKLWEAWEKPKRIIYNCGHAGVAFYRRSIAKESLSFIKERV
jgi:hypothetical protein